MCRLALFRYEVLKTGTSSIEKNGGVRDAPLAAFLYTHGFYLQCFVSGIFDIALLIAFTMSVSESTR